MGRTARTAALAISSPPPTSRARRRWRKTGTPRPRIFCAPLAIVRIRRKCLIGVVVTLVISPGFPAEIPVPGDHDSGRVAGARPGHACEFHSTRFRPRGHGSHVAARLGAQRFVPRVRVVRRSARSRDSRRGPRAGRRDERGAGPGSTESGRTFPALTPPSRGLDIGDAAGGGALPRGREPCLTATGGVGLADGSGGRSSTSVRVGP